MRDQEFQLIGSKYYSSLVTIVSFISLIIWLNLPISWLFRLGGSAVIFVYCGFILYRYGLLLSPHSIISLRYQDKNKWYVSMRQSGVVSAELRGDSTVTGCISILRFNLSNCRWPLSCIVLKDSLPRDVYRQLLVVLKM